jgi:hypothetical protein
MSEELSYVEYERIKRVHQLTAAALHPALHASLRASTAGRQLCFRSAWKIGLTRTIRFG